MDSMAICVAKAHMGMFMDDVPDMELKDYLSFREVQTCRRAVIAICSI